jgi:hypothetical protein
MKNTIIGLVVIIIIAVGGYFYMKNSGGDTVTPADTTDTTPVVQAPVDKTKTVIGKSVESRDIVAYHYGEGTSTELLFVGGIHGGYEWNTALVAYQLMDYLKANPTKIPSNVKVTVIPVLNPDGLNKVVGTTSPFTASQVSSSQDTQVAGRFNAHTVDLNRNFDCDWQTEAKWQNKTVSGGASAFSEPESSALKNYVEQNKPTAAIVWYSSAGGVFASSCHNGVLPETNTLTKTYADASKYPAHQNFDFYEITGDMVNWFAKNNIPAISVLLTNHTDTEWSKNQAGVDAVLKYYSQK